jgi:SulP family sulfate permease
MAGIILIIMGLCHMGSLIKYIPYTITTGFTAGIAVTIFVGQIKDFLGLTVVTSEPLIETTDKLMAVFHFIGTTNFQAVIVGCVCLAILIVFPKITSKIPPSLIAVLAGIAMVKGLHMNVNTIGDLYEISSSLPSFTMPTFSFEAVQKLLPDAFTIAILAAIESLLSCVVADGMIQSHHRSNMELVAQGAGNIASALFGGIPATGAIARTAANVKNGGRTPVAGMVHAVVLLLILVVLMPYASLIPMPTIAAILFMVAYNMSEWRQFKYLAKTAPKSDILVLVLTFVLTVLFDLVVAIEVNMVLAALLFMKRMSEETTITGWQYSKDDEDTDVSYREIPENIRVYELSGPLFFGAADKIATIHTKEFNNCLILRMKSVTAIDATAMRSLEKLYETCKEKNVTLIFSHVNSQPLSAMKKAGLYDKVGAENFCSHIDEALARGIELSNAIK